ncbi:MAG: type III-B CRISPR module RAMP protein Cmr6 [Tannerella sp.]|nr:type III-B CRISPR module RAMP protein Cmr6 [Tannerella sp.]
MLGTDYITPHPDPLKNPKPIKFLKILPEVEVTFRFQLQNNLITAAKKESLFRQILLDFGIGAKTNVGYGQFSC